MPNNLMTVFAKESQVANEELTSLKIGTKRSTGEKFAKATTIDGTTFIKSLSKSGVEQNRTIKIPSYSTKEERNEIIRDLSRDYIQDDIADMLEVSQSTVSNTLRKK